MLVFVSSGLQKPGSCRFVGIESEAFEAMSAGQGSNSSPGVHCMQQVSYDLREPYVMAYNSASAGAGVTSTVRELFASAFLHSGIQRQEKWSSHGELARSVKFPKAHASCF